jgi:rRNA maturation RNase YbeY
MTPDPDPALRKPRAPRLTVDVCDAKGRPASAPGLAKWLSTAAPASARGSVTLALVSNSKMRELNLAYRGKDYATDVLSFPAADTPHPDPLPVGGEREKRGEPGLRPALDQQGSGKLRRGLRGADPAKNAGAGRLGRATKLAEAGEATPLGDIVIATGVAARQAREAGHSLRTELRVLALHGLLHLLGYDHEHDRGEMARVERRLRRRGGLREGLIERAV